MDDDQKLLASWLDHALRKDTTRNTIEGKNIGSAEPLSEDTIANFMFEEYTTLRERRQSLEQTGESRVNFFLATISGTIVGLALLSQVSSIGEVLPFITGAIFIGLLWIGFTIFARVVNRSISLILLDRGMNRVRRYFVDRKPDIAIYLSLPINDDKPGLGYSIIKEGKYSLRGLPPLIAIINSILAFVGIVILSKLTFRLNTILSSIFGIIVFGYLITAHYRYYVRQVKAAAERQKTRINFPSRRED